MAEDVESKIEQELLAATGVKPKKNEDQQAYLTRLMRAVAKLKDPEWEGLSTDAQEWNNGAAEAHKAGDEIADFPDYAAIDDNPPVDEEVDEEEEVVPPPVVKAKDKEKKPIEKPAPKPAVVAGTGRKVSACHMIKKMVVKDPTITVAQLSENLKSDGLKVSDVTIATLRSDLRDTLRVLNELNIAKFTL